jgi:hypothetical protein
VFISSSQEFSASFFRVQIVQAEWVSNSVFLSYLDPENVDSEFLWNFGN